MNNCGLNWGGGGGVGLEILIHKSFMSWCGAAKSWILHAWRGRGLSLSLISRVTIGVTPSRVLITLLISNLLSPLPVQV